MKMLLRLYRNFTVSREGGVPLSQSKINSTQFIQINSIELLQAQFALLTYILFFAYVLCSISSSLYHSL
jgi:hypothetical protein